MAKKKKTNISIKTQLLVATGTVLLLAGFGFFVGWLDSTMDIHLTGKAQTVSLSDVTLKGKSTCLAHKGSEPSTMECAIGLVTPGGITYAIKGKTLVVGSDQLELTGTLTSASGDEKYNIAGTLTVK